MSWRLALRAANDEHALDVPIRAQSSPCLEHLDVEPAHRLAAVEDEVPDLDDGGLSPAWARQQHVDGARTGSVTGQRGFRFGDPAACRRDPDQEVLTTEVLHVARQRRAGCLL